MGAHVVTASVGLGGSRLGPGQLHGHPHAGVSILLPQQNDGFLARQSTFFGTADDLLDGDLSAN